MIGEIVGTVHYVLKSETRWNLQILYVYESNIRISFVFKFLDPHKTS